MGTHAITTGQGETFTLNVEYQDSAGTAVDLTGYTVAMELHLPDGATSYAGTVDALGNIAVTVADEVTVDWPTGQRSYRLVLSFPNGDKKWLLTGPFTVNG